MPHIPIISSSACVVAEVSPEVWLVPEAVEVLCVVWSSGEAVSIPEYSNAMACILWLLEIVTVTVGVVPPVIFLA